jgi:transposase
VLLGHACIGMTRACIDPHGYDAGKKIKGKAAHSCRHIRSSAPRHRSSGRHSRSRWRRSHHGDTVRHVSPFLKTLFADSGYQEPKFAKALAKVLPHLDIEIVKRSDQVSGFMVLPKRWIVECTICVAQSLPKACQGLGESQPKALAFLRLASIRLMLRKLCNPPEVSGRTLI